KLSDLQASPVLLGNDALKAHDWPGAAAHFNAALAANPNQMLARLGLGQADLQLGKTDDALGEYRRATEIASDSGRLLTLGEALAAVGDVDGTRATYARALTVTPDDKRALLAVGDTLVYQGDLTGATKHFEDAVAIDYPRGSAAYELSLGSLWEARDLYSQA